MVEGTLDSNRYMTLRDALHDHFPEYNRTGGWSEELGEYIAGGASAGQALLYVAIFNPPLREIEGLIFQELYWMGPEDADEASAKIREALDQYDGDTKRVQKSFNLLELPALFEHDDLAKEEERLLAEFLADAWRGWLLLTHPERDFVVELDENDDEDAVDISITFYEDR